MMGTQNGRNVRMCKKISTDHYFINWYILKEICLKLTFSLDLIDGLKTYNTGHFIKIDDHD